MLKKKKTHLEASQKKNNLPVHGVHCTQISAGGLELDVLEGLVEEGWGSHTTPLDREILLGSQLENRENHYLFTVLFYSVYLFISFF